MSDLQAEKATARAEAFQRRAQAHEMCAIPGSGVLSSVLAAYRGVPIAGYLPIRTEIDPIPAMAEAAAHGPVGVPRVVAKGAPLDFLIWEDGCALEPGAFNVPVPVSARPVIPEILIVPLVAFTRSGLRLGYGGGFYDRTLEQLRRNGPVLAIGFAYAGQQVSDLPSEATDAPLDLIVTEREVITPAPRPQTPPA